jgi:hypothetical protein
MPLHPLSEIHLSRLIDYDMNLKGEIKDVTFKDVKTPK